MANPRYIALNELVGELEKFKINVSEYFGDAEPQGYYDTVLSGKLEALTHFCRALGWSDLASTLSAHLPLQCSAVTVMETVQGYVLPEIRRLIERTDIENITNPHDWFWQFVHPRVAKLARSRFEAGFFGDAVEAAYKEVNDAVKMIHKDKTGSELDGAGLMTTTFSPSNPVIRLSEMLTTSDQDTQKGYMPIFAGAMTGIRNPKAHGNLSPDSRKALHLISLASLLMYKIDERV